MSVQVEQVLLYTGPMDSGKTNALFSKMHELDNLGIRYAAFQPIVDVRSEGTIVPKTYEGSTEPNCTRIPSLADISDDHLRDANVVIVDEFTMFGFDNDRQPIDGYYDNAIRHLASLGVSEVYASGLNVAANEEMFPMFKRAMEKGAEVKLYTASCMVPVNGLDAPKCRKVARNSQIYSISQEKPYDPASLPMLLPQGERPDLGYRPVCVGHMAINATELLDFNTDYPS